MTEQERLERRRETKQRYKRSAKGKAADAAYRERNREKERKRLRDNAEQYNENRRRKYQEDAAHRAVVIARARRRYAEKPEAVKAYVRAWQQANPEKNLLRSRRDTARRRGAPLDALAVEYHSILRGDPCSYCGGPATEMDHIVPVFLNGDGAWNNFTPACRSCNARKHDKPLLLFLSGH